MADYGTIREQIRTLVDPLFIKFREELMGSGVSFGRLTEGVLPSTTVVVGGGGGTVDPDDLGYIRGIKTYSGGTLVGNDQKELSFINAHVASIGDRTTITIASGYNDPLTTNGDILYRAGGTTTRLPVGEQDQFLRVSGGLPVWQTVAITISGLVDPTVATGDMLYRSASGVTRLPIGTSGQILSVSGGLPAWANIANLGIPRQIAWYEDGTVTVANSKGPLRRLDANVTLTSAYIYVKTAPTGASLVVDIKKATSPDGTYTTIFSSTPSISASAFVGSSTSFSTINLSAGDYLRMDITQVGSTVAGASLTVDLNMVTR